MESLVERTLAKISSINAPQRKFIATLIGTLAAFQGKATFRNLSRFCHWHEGSFARWYQRRFDFMAFNWALIERVVSSPDTQRAPMIAAFDASFLKKSGRHTAGLGHFYNGSAGRAERGMEVSLLCVIDLNANTAYSLNVEQTLDVKDCSRVSQYADTVVRAAPFLHEKAIVHVAVDAYYSKKSFIDPVCQAKLHLVGKLRRDACLHLPYEGRQLGRGRPRVYGDRVDVNGSLSAFSLMQETQTGDTFYQRTVHSKAFKRRLYVVIIRQASGKQALLYTTDLALSAAEVVRFYRARFQIEFVFRDAKQHTGLNDCQARDTQAMATHLNASLCALNVLKLEDRLAQRSNQPCVISIASWRRRRYNENLLQGIFAALGADLNDEKNQVIFQAYCRFGVIAS